MHEVISGVWQLEVGWAEVTDGILSMEGLNSAQVTVSHQTEIQARALTR